MQDFWNRRYQEHPYVYGVEPNQYFREELAKLPAGRIFLPAEGQGRNAVHAARLGWEVIACDFSDVGRRQAEELAARHGVEIDYRVAEFGELILAPAYFDCIALVYAHFPADKRRLYHRRLVNSLKPGGTLLLEAFSKEQLGRPSGGPQSLEMLYSAAELEEDFRGLSLLEVWTGEIVLEEGEFHRGAAAVVRVHGVKP